MKNQHPLLVPPQHGDLAEVFSRLPAKSNPSPANIDMRPDPKAHPSGAHETAPVKFWVIDDDVETVPPVSVISVQTGAHTDTFRVELEISLEVAECLGRVGAAFWPVFGAVEERTKREKEKAARLALRQERMDRLQKAGRTGYLLSRREESPERRQQIINEIAGKFGFTPEAVELKVRHYKKNYLPRLRIRRNPRIHQRAADGLSIPEIAIRFRLSKQRVYEILRNSK